MYEGLNAKPKRHIRTKLFRGFGDDSIRLPRWLDDDVMMIRDNTRSCHDVRIFCWEKGCWITQILVFWIWRKCICISVCEWLPRLEIKNHWTASRFIQTWKFLGILNVMWMSWKQNWLLSFISMSFWVILKYIDVKSTSYKSNPTT